MTQRVVIVGGGLAGLACALDLAEGGADVQLMEARPVVGGRTASWDEDGMRVESGLHRFLGFFSALPDLLRRCGIDLDDILCWEDEVEIRVPDGGPSGILGLAPRHRPWRTLRGLLGNNDLLSPLDKVSLSGFVAAGVRDYLRRPLELDRWSVDGYARAHRVTRRARHHLLVPLTAGIFFLPPERFSAAIFFGLLAPNLPRLHQLRLGAFTGGMTDVMCGPIAQVVQNAGGRVRTGAPVDRLVVDGGRVRGVVVAGEHVTADHVVVATSLAKAQRLLRPAVEAHAWFRPMLSMPTTPSVTVQIDLDRPATAVDRTTFAPGTALACFAEQSRTTFPGSGRLSVILSPPEEFLHMDDGAVIERVQHDAERIGLQIAPHAARARVIRHPEDFQSLEPGHLRARPDQATPLPGLSLAGDYTAQPFVATMEGAVVSGHRAAAAVGHDAGPGHRPRR